MEFVDGILMREMRKRGIKNEMFGQRRHADGQQTHGKMLDITHQQNTNQNHDKI